MAFDATTWMTPSGGYEITNSVRFEETTSFLTHDQAAGNQRTWTWSAWVKKGAITGGQQLFSWWSGGTSNNQHWIGINGDGSIEFKLYSGDGSLHGGNTHVARLKTNAKLNDNSAWYNIVCVWDTTNGTAGNRARIYVNGVRLTDFSVATYPSQNTDGYMNRTSPAVTVTVGGAFEDGDNAEKFKGYMADVNFIDGTALNADSFGETGNYGEWKPIDTSTLTFGTNGYRLEFKQSTANATGLGLDTSGEGNNYSVQGSGLAATDQMLDSPTNNFATLNPLGWQWSEESAKMSEGNLSFGKDGDDWTHANGTQLIPKTKKIYFEVRGIDALAYVGIALANENSNAYDEGSRPDGGYVKGLFTLYIDGNTQAVAYRATTGGTALGAQTFSGSNFNNAVVGVAVDIANSNIKFFINNTEILSQSPNNVIDVNKDYLPFVAGSDGLEMAVNFGQDSSFAGAVTAQGNQDANNVGDFFYAPPSGYLALCTKNLFEPAVIPSQHFNAILYTGNDNDNHAITGVGFQPDFLWIKNRGTTDIHELVDAVRGQFSGGNGLGRLRSNDTTVEIDSTIEGFTADGFTLDGDNTGYNGDGGNYVAWNWKAGNATLASNAFTQGGIASTCSRNVDAGFSIVSYTGTGTAATVGHGLSKTPEIIIVKNRDTAKSWNVYHSGNSASSPEDFTIRLNLTDAKLDTPDNAWNDTAPTSSLFTIGSGTQVNTDDDKFIAYCFHSVDGYSKVGSFIANDNADGTFVNTNMRVSYLLVKSSSNNSNDNDWAIFDNKRNISNVVNLHLDANANQEENHDSRVPLVDFVSNGFKLRSSHSETNGGSESYIYLAFAETPFKYSNAR